MVVIGLTGSIGMGKSTVAAMFSAHGVPMYDADATVHRLYSGPLVEEIEAAFPGVVREGSVERAALARQVTGDPKVLRRLEAIVHPAVRAEESAFLERHARARFVLLDIPLLLETDRAGDMDAVVVVSAPPAVQRARVLARPGMSAERLDAILARQMPDGEKRRRAHFVIDTSGPLDATRRQVAAIMRAVAPLPGRNR